MKIKIIKIVTFKCAMVSKNRIMKLLIKILYPNKGQIFIDKIIAVNLFNLFQIQTLLTVGTRSVSTNKEKLQRKRNLLWPKNLQEHLKIVS